MDRVIGEGIKVVFGLAVAAVLTVTSVLAGAPLLIQAVLFGLFAFCLYLAVLVMWPHRPKRAPKLLGTRREYGMDWEAIRQPDGSIQMFGPRCPVDSDGWLWNDIN